MLIDDLKKLGFEEKEAKVYLALLELGESPVTQIAKKADIKRTTGYHILEFLMKKGYVSSVKRKSDTIYLAQNPKKIIADLEAKEKLAHNILPQLLSINNADSIKPSIRYFEGQEGLIEIFKNELEYSNQELLTWWSKNFDDHMPKNFFQDFYVPERKKHKIWMRAIAPDTEFTRDYTKNDIEVLRKTRFRQENSGSEIKVEIRVYGKNLVNILSLKEQIGLIIESQDIHDSLKTIFEAHWNSLTEK